MRSVPLLRALSLLLLVSSLSVTALDARSRGFDHSRFDRALSRAVANGRVDYTKLRNDRDFASYVASLATASIDRLGVDERLAFWLNAYNALTIRNVLDNRGMRRPTDIAGFFDRKRFAVAGRSLTLNEIENNVIRPTFGEPLIHFGLVCAARSCPPLAAKAFTAETVRAQLARNARAFLASSANGYDTRGNMLSLSKIFDWYREDFGGDAGIRRFVKQYGTTSMQKGVGAATRITFLEYDWTLNAK